MTITADTVVVGVDPDIPPEKFEQVLDDAGSPAKGSRGYLDIVHRRVSPAFALAIFKHESRFGTVGIVPQYSLRNPGARRSTVTGEGTEIQIPGRGQFVKYETWTQGWADLAYSLVAPHFVYVKENRRTIRQIIERWAPPEDNNNPDSYINAVVNSMNEWIEGTPVTAQIPGFKWFPADSLHHRKGRANPISGFAIHYTGGTNSLGWLTTDSPGSNPSGGPVSATFLIKHNPTMQDRGWQLVRIEDTPYTTGAPVNSFTVSSEYEQIEGQYIPDIAYEVMAQTILDTADYVKRNSLGEIPISRQSIKGHKEWVGDNRVCPDGIEVDRIVSIAAGDSDPSGKIEFPTGYSLQHGFADFYRSLGDNAWRTIGVPIENEEADIHNGEARVTVQRTDVGWLQWNPATDEIRMATEQQRKGIERDLGIADDAGLTLERQREIGETLVNIGNEMRG